MTLRPNTDYYYRVKAINSTQESEYSEVIKVTTAVDNSLAINPLSATAPVIYKTIPFSNKVEIYLQEFNTNEYIQEIKLTLSTNSDYSSPIYDNLTIKTQDLNHALENDSRYLLATLANLAANTLYYGKVTLSNKTSLSSATSFTFTTDVTLAAPTSVGITLLTAITARANWIKVPDATGYRIDVSTTSNFSSFVVNNVDAGDVDHYDIPVLVENTTYYYRVRSYNVSVTSKNSNVITFTTLDNVETYDDLTIDLAAPWIRQVRNVKDTEFEVIWNADSNAVSFTYDLSTSATFSNFILQDQTILTNTVKLTGLTANTIYYFRVKSDHTSKSSQYSTTVVPTLSVNTNLNPPQLLSSSVIYSTGFLTSWIKRTYANRYYIQLSTSNTFATVSKDFYVGDIDSFFIDSLTPNTVYYLRIYALNTLEVSSASNTVSVTTDALLPDITLNPETELSSSTVRLNWTLDSTYVSYLISIYKKFDKSGYIGEGYFRLKDVGNVSSYYLDIFLDESTVYNYIITGITSEGDSKDSDLGEFTTRSISPIVGISNNGQYIEWSEETNRVEVSTDRLFRTLLQGWNPRTIPSSPKKYDISNLLLENSCYYIRGYYDNSGVKGDYSNIISTFAKEPILLQPTVTKTTALLRWKKNLANIYRIQVKKDISGTYTPITGFAFPLNVGDVSEYYLTDLVSDSDYSVQIQYFDESSNKYTALSLPVYFTTHEYDSPADLSTNGGLTVPTLTLTDASFDRFSIGVTGSQSKYLVEISRRSDFLTIDSYIELADTDFPYTYLGKPNSTYYVRVYGVSGTDKTNIDSDSIATSALPSYGSNVSGTPTLSTATVLNDTEVILDWLVTSNTTGYTVEVSESLTFTLLDNTVSVTFIDINQALVSGLSGTKTYYMRLYGYNDHSISSYSNVITVDTTP